VKKRGNLVCTIFILFPEVASLILKFAIIFLPVSSKNNKFPLIIIFEIIIFIIDVCLNINLLKDEIKNFINIFINTEIKINLIWKSTNSKKFEMKINKTEKFHDVIIKFLKANHKLFKYYIIQKVYTPKTKSEQEDKKIETNSNNNENNNLQNNSNNNITDFNNNINNENNNDNNEIKVAKFSPIEDTNRDLKEEISESRTNASEIKNEMINKIEDENKYEYKTFKELNLDHNIEIFFITRDTRDENEEEKMENIKQKFESKEPKINDKLYLIFETKDEKYPLFIDKNLKLEDALLLFQKEYYSYIDNKIKVVEYDRKNIFLEKDKSIEQLKLKDKGVLKLTMEDNKDGEDTSLIINSI